jgi:hypothetical protein
MREYAAAEKFDTAMLLLCCGSCCCNMLQVPKTTRLANGQQQYTQDVTITTDASSSATKQMQPGHSNTS